MLKKALEKCGMHCLLKMLILFEKTMGKWVWRGGKPFLCDCFTAVQKQTNATELDCGEEAHCQTIVVKIIFLLTIH